MSKQVKLSGRKKNERTAAYIFTIPAMFLLVAFLVVPILYTIRYSLFQYQIVRPDNISFIGLQNYTKLFQDENFWIALKNTVYFTVLVVPFQCVLALALAMLVSSKFRGVAIFRTMYFSPQLTSMVVVSILWTVLYNSNPSTGLINSMLTSLGMEPVNFLSNAKTAMNSIIFMSGWQGAGYQMMIFLAGLQGIPRDQYEAASVDGATKVFVCDAARTERNYQICSDDHNDSGDETVYPALRYDPRRAEKQHKDTGLLYLYPGLPAGEFRLRLRSGSRILCHCGYHVTVHEETDCGYGLRGEGTVNE